MVSIPVLIIFLTVIAVYLTGCLIIHVRDSRDDKPSDRNGQSDWSAPRHGGAHAIHL
jgi:hypothetical protein